MQNLKTFLNYTKRYKKLIFITTFFLFLESFIDGISPYLLKEIIENGTDINARMKSLFFLFFFVLLLGIVSSLLGSYFSSKASSKLCYDLRKSIFSLLLKTNFRDSSRVDVTSATTVLSNDIETVGTIFLSFLRMFLKIPFLFLISFLFMFSMHRFYFSIVILFLPILAFLLSILLKKAFPYFEQEQQVLDKVVECTLENIKGKQFIQVTTTLEKQRNRFMKKNDKLRKLNILSMKTLSLSSTVIMAVMYFLTLFLLLLSYKNPSFSIENIGTVMAFLEYLTLLLSSLLMGGMLLLLLCQSLVSFKRICAYLNLKEGQQIEKKQISPHTLSFRNVSFSYHEKGDYVLKNLNFIVKKGEKIAIVGPTGAGKSTFLKLMAQLYEPTKGEIFLNEENIKTCETKDVILYNPQNMFLFKGTLFFNLLFYQQKWDANSLIISDTASIVKKKRKGLKTEINASHNNYSGGEKNRISIARAVNRNPAFLLLDDSLNATDLKTEKRILKKLISSKKEETILYVSSRLSSLDLFDKILFLHQGKIEAFGNLEEVLKNPLFLKMYTIRKEMYDGR